MTDSTDAKNTTSTPGALRLQAHRRRLRAGELVRTEIVIPKTVRESAQGIADAEGAGYLETVSALTQLGLEVYQKQAATNTLRSASLGSGFARASSELAPSLQSVAELSANMAFCSSLQTLQPSNHSTLPNPGTTSPLSRFLKARKEGQS